MPDWVNNNGNGGEPTRQRKRWEIEDKKQLKNLKYQLADSGSKDIQFDLGRQLIEDSDDIGDVNKQTQGIGYLKKAAEQGHELALELLGACFRTGRGITAANEGEIRKFLEMTPGERSAKRAALELFASLSGGEEFVTVEQLERRMREIYKLQKKKNSIQCEGEAGPSNGKISIKSREDDEEESGFSSKSSSPVRLRSRKNRLIEDSNQISEANLVQAAHNYSNGIIPAVNQVLTVSVPHPETLDHVPCLHRLFLHPTIFLALLYHRFISTFSSFPSEDIAKYQIPIVLVGYAIVSTENFFILLPVITYYVTIAVMVVASFKMLKSKHEFIDFRIWSGLFLSYDEQVNANESENLYLRNNIKPYFWFFVSFALNLLIYPLVMDQWLPHSEITVIAFILTLITMFCFMFKSSMHNPDFIMLFSFAMNVLAKYPYELDSVVNNTWRFLDLKISGISTFVIGSEIEFSMNCRALLYLLIPIFMFVLAKRRNWRGVFQFLFPHLVTLSWLQISIISSQSATAFGLVRSTLGLAGVLLFLPLFGLVTLLIPVFAAVEWMALSDSKNRIFVTISTSIIAMIGSCFMAITNRTAKYITFFQILLCILASCFLFRPYIKGPEDSYGGSYLQAVPKVIQNERILETLDESVLNWETYHKYCISSPFTNQIKSQLRCQYLEGSPISFDNAVISKVRISQVKNWRESLLQNFLPEFLSTSLTCYFGEKNHADCFQGENCEIKDFLKLQKKCNLDKYNIYEYEIIVKMASPLNKGILNLNSGHESTIIIRADHVFGNFTQKINASDKVFIKGILRSKINSRPSVSWSVSEDQHAFIDLTAIGCMQCTDKSLDPISIKRNLKIENRFEDLQRAFKYLLNTLFNPLVTFK